MNAYWAARVTVTDAGCWEWNLSRNRSNYGQATMRARYIRPVGAHRLSYEMHIGPIPDGLTVDHLCFNPPCVNPGHLRLLTLSENAANQREAYKTHCKRGHELEPENTRIKDGGNGRRECKTCHRDREREAGKARRAPHLKGRARGERSPKARLTEALVISARQRNAAGEPVMRLALEFGVSRPTLQDAVQGKTWTHLPMPREAAT